MEIICDSCSAKLKIPEEKIPKGKTATLTCPKCKNKITVTNPEKDEEVKESTEDTGETLSSFDFQEEDDDSNHYDASDKPFDFIEEEGKTALVCESDESIRYKITKVLDLMEYHITVTESTRDTLKKMRYHDYHLVVINENFDTVNPDANGIMIYLERLNMSTRRNMLVALLTNRYRTMDNMMAFVKSVNMIINLDDIDNFDKILSLGISENDYFYRVFKESLKKTGRV